MKNNIRSSQLISPFGIGQIVNFPGEQSYMICGLNLWDKAIESRKAMGAQIDENDFTFNEARLQNLLNVQSFRKPIPFKRTGNANKYIEIPGVRFPQWHHCTNSRCGAMRKIELDMSDYPRCKECAKGKNEFKMIPVRFIAACSRGHIQDIPFKEWVHSGPVPRDNKTHKLLYRAGSGSGDLGSITIECSCGARKSLAGIMNVSKTAEGMVYNSALAAIGLDEEEKDQIRHDNPNDSNPVGQYCKGSRPWLGPFHMDGSCGEHLHVLIRGGSNIHYSEIISALYLPEFDAETNPKVGKIIDDLGLESISQYYNQTDDHSILRAILQTRAEIKNNLISEDTAFNEIERIINDSGNRNIDGDINSEQDLRLQEYQYILKERKSENSDFKSVVNTFENYESRDFLEKYFEKVVLIEKLKETRAFKGFARIDPIFRIDKTELSAEKLIWLPATQVYGEGIFLKFNDRRMNDWLDTEFSENDYSLIDRYQEKVRTPNPRHEEGLNPAFVMMHTFAHLLIKRLCFNCGYGSSSLRERIYFSHNEETKMNGILIYTSSGDSEGSLGGLVRQGRQEYLGNLIKEAIADAEWCSADPVCSDIGQSGGQGPDNVNGSACHNCCLVPETSCEEFNMLLDRAVVVGSFDDSLKGYFKENI